jgi:hemoglobin/transferrin/lactoferrin receptor protein
MTPKADEDYENVNPGDEFVPEKISDSNVSLRLGTIFDITDNASVYFQYSQGFKVPPYDLAYAYLPATSHGVFIDWGTFTAYGTEIIPTADLVPEESDSYEIGIRGSIGNFSYNLSAYLSDYDNFIQINYIGERDGGTYFGLPFIISTTQYQNIEKAEISGFEWRLDYYLGNNFSVFFNGEWMDSEDKSTGDQLRSIRPVTGALGVNFFAGNFSMDVIARRALDMDKNPEDTLTTESWTSWDMFARYDFNGRVQLSAGILNMFDNEYVEYASIAGIPYDDRSLSPYTEPGRTLSARIKVNF